MSFKISQSDLQPDISAGMSNISDASEAKFGFNRGQNDNTFNTLCIGNFTNTLHPIPEISETPQLREITNGEKNSICAGKFIVMFAQTDIKNGEVVSAAVDSNGNITCTPCKAGSEAAEASQVLGVALEAATTGNPINIAVSGFCNAIGNIPGTSGGTGGAKTGSTAIILPASPGLVVTNERTASNVASCGMVVKSMAASTFPFGTAPYNYLIRIMPGHEAY